MANRAKKLTVAELCCVCMASSEADTTWLNIINDSDDDAGKCSLMSLMEEVTGSMINSDVGRLPQRICPSCLRTAKIAFNYKRRFEKSFHWLIEQMERTSPLQALTDEDTESPTEDKDHTGKLQIKCSQCPRVFNYKSELKNHFRIHSGERPFKCPQCPKTYSRKNSLYYHRRTHTGERPFKCSECSKTFTHNGSLKDHLRTHTGERPFQCTHCTRTFSQKSSLNSHLRTHAGNRHFKCSECSKTFIYLSTLQNHMRLHTGENCFECVHCSMTFIQSNHYNKHRCIHKGERRHHIRIQTGDNPLSS